MSDTETIVAPRKPKSSFKAKPAQSAVDTKAFAHVERWIEVIREGSEQGKSA